MKNRVVFNLVRCHLIFNNKHPFQIKSLNPQTFDTHSGLDYNLTCDFLHYHLNPQSIECYLRS